VTSVADRIQKKWLLLGGFVLVVGVVVWSSQEQPVPQGGELEFTFTLVPPDAKGLACSNTDPIEGERCEFDSEGAPVKVEHPLRPYTTTSQEVVLLAGVFEDPAVAKWLQEADKKNDDARIVVHCGGTLLGHAPAVKVHWAPDAPFDVASDLRIGRVKNCRVTTWQP